MENQMKLWSKKNEKIITCVWPPPSVSALGGQMEATLDLALNSLPHAGQTSKMSSLCGTQVPPNLNSDTMAALFNVFMSHKFMLFAERLFPRSFRYGFRKCGKSPASQILTETLLWPCLYVFPRSFRFNTSKLKSI